MATGYVVFAGIALYLLLLRILDSGKMSPVRAAAILVIGYYALLSIVLGIEYASRDIPLWQNLLEPMRIVTAVVQLAVAVGVFYKVEENSDSYTSYMLWGGVGLALTFFIAPSAVQQLFTFIAY